MEVVERRKAELEFVAAAYAEDEAWCDNVADAVPTISRRLDAFSPEKEEEKACFLLHLRLVGGYPVENCLEVAGTVEEGRTSSRLLKNAYDALPDLLVSCRRVSELNRGEESIFEVLGCADQWILDKWPRYVESSHENAESASDCAVRTISRPVLARNLIYSHHIISKKKRSDLRDLASDLRLTGFMKTGWPGLIIIEGEEHRCQDFYNSIRRWAWQYLVLRGEMSEECTDGAHLEALRRFPPFTEVEDMAIVANHCREVGLEGLFLTSMKVYDNGVGPDKERDTKDPPHGALLLVDHMNDGKGYRRWLRRTCNAFDVSLLLKQFYPNNDFNGKPVIIVGLVGSSDGVAAVLKRWRTSKVDVDSRGKPCLERMMTVLIEGILKQHPSIDTARESEDHFTTSKEKLLGLIGCVGGEEWTESLPRPTMKSPP